MIPEHCRCHQEALPGSQQPTPAQGAFAFLRNTQICSLLSEYWTLRVTVTSVYGLAGRLVLAQGPQHATQGFQSGSELRSNRFLRFEEGRLDARMTWLPWRNRQPSCQQALGSFQALWQIISPSRLKNREMETHLSTKTVKSLFSFCNECVTTQSWTIWGSILLLHEKTTLAENVCCDVAVDPFSNLIFLCTDAS